MNVETTGADPERPDVLVVDDDGMMCALARESLQAAGFAVETAADGETALALLESSRPDLILLDVLLPGIDGISLCRRLRAAPETRETPICIMTGLDDRASIQQAYDAGATDFVIKPPSWPILIQHFRHLLRSSFLTRELAAAKDRLQGEICERKRAEKALRESEERLRLALMAANQGLYDLNLQTGETVVSAEYARMLGYEPEALTETNAKFRQRLHVDDRRRVQRAFRGHLAGALGEYRAEFRQKTRSGDWKWILSLGKVVEWDKAGRPLRMLGIHSDITELKRDEAELRKLSQAVEQSANIIIVTDSEGLIEYVNPRFVEKSGYSPAEALGQTPRLVKSGEHSPEFYKELWETIKSGQVWKGEMHNRRKDGTLYWEDTTITPIIDPAGTLVNFMAVKEDITARKELEQTEHEQRRLAEALRDVAAALNSSLDLEEVLDRILDGIGRIALYDAVFMVLFEGEAARLVRQRGLSPAQAGSAGVQTHFRLSDLPILGPLFATRNIHFIPDTRDDPTCASGCRMVPGTRSCLGIPLQIRGGLAGAIILTSARPGLFTATSAQRLQAFADQASVAIDNARLFEQAHRLSVTDGLTGLNNRRHFFDLAKVEYERIRRHGRSLSVVMVDIDRFKSLNDTYGHLVGDAVLRETARRIQETVRTIDIPARYGGEEFVVLMPETALDEALLVAERVRLRVAESVAVSEGLSVYSTISVGVAEINEQCSALEDALKCADEALYAAKAAGRNRVEAYHRERS